MGSHRFRHPMARLAGAVLALGLVAGCSSAEEAAQEPDSTAPLPGGSVNEVVDDGPGQPGGRLVYGLVTETDGWNPTLSRWAPSGLTVARTFFDPLVAYDEELGWKPYLAESFTPNADATEWVITLRPDVRFTSGRLLDADTLAEFLQYVKDSPLTKETMYFISAIEARGEREVVLTTKEPWWTLPYAFTNQIGFVADPDWLNGGDPEKPVGTGPFIVQSWERGRRMVVEKNPDYWREGYPLLDEIEFQPFEDELSRVQAFQAGDVDVAMVTTGAQLEQIRVEAAQGEAQVISNGGGETVEQFVMLNTKAPPLDDPEVRRAVVTAIDPQQYIDVVHQGQYDVARGPFAPGSPWFAETDYPGFRPDEARTLVEQIEARTGEPLAFTLVSAPSPVSRASVQQLQGQWAAVGIDVEIQTVDLVTLIRDVVFGQYQTTLWSQFEAPHPVSDTIWWAPWAAPDPPEAGLNFARNENAAMGEAIELAGQQTDRAEEVRYFGEIQRLLAEDLPYVWLLHGTTDLVADADVVNLVNWANPDGSRGLPIASGSHPLYQVWLRR